jgi:O-antigen/teichoic acid export membrane protein
VTAGFVGAAGALSFARGLTQLGTFGAGLLVARYLGPDTFGQYAVLLAISTIVVSGPGSGIPVLAQRESAAGRATKDMVRGLLAATLLATTVGVSALAVAGHLLIGGSGGALDGLFAGGSAVILSVAALGSAINSGHGHFRSAAAGEAMIGLLLPTVTACSLLLGLGLGGALGALLVGAAPGALFLVGAARRASDTGSHGPSSSLKGYLSRATPFAALGLANGGYGRLDTVVLRLVAGSTTAGLYAAAYRILAPMAILLSGFGSVFFSRLLASGPAWRAIHRRGRWMLLTAISPLIVVAILAAPLLVKVVYGPNFSGAATPARILAVSVIPLALYWPSAHALNAFGRQRTWTGILLGGLGLDALLVALLGRWWGADGTALAWVFTEVIVLAAVQVAAGRLVREVGAQSAAGATPAEG